MKKMLLGAVGLSAMLASCGGVEVVFEPVTIKRRLGPGEIVGEDGQHDAEP